MWIGGRGQMCATVQVGRSEGTLRESVLSFSQAGPGDWTQATSFGGSVFTPWAIFLLSFCFLSNCQRWQLKHHLDVHNPGDFAVRSTIQGIPKHPNNNIKKEKSSKDVENCKMITRSGSLRRNRTDYTRSPSCLMLSRLYHTREVF